MWIFIHAVIRVFCNSIYNDAPSRVQVNSMYQGFTLIKVNS